MKNTALFSLLTIFMSCSTNNIVSNYITNRKEVIKPEKIYIFEFKMNVNETLGILKNGHFKEKLNSKYFSYENYLLLREKYKTDTITEKWTDSDFKKNGCILINNNLLYLKKNNPEVFDGNRLFFSFSKPLYLRSKKSIIIHVSEAKGFGNITFSGIFIMKKKNSKWEIIEKIENPELN